MTDWITIDFGAVEVSDSRGNRLLRYQVRDIRDGIEKRLYLYAHRATAEQVQSGLRSLGCEPLAMTDEQRREWTHRFRLDGPLDDESESFLELMKEVLTLNVPSEIDAALALDFYKNPESHDDPNQWENTHAGELVSRGKYGGFAKEGLQLAAELSDVIRRHPTYNAADAIVLVPGSTPRRFGERLASAVSKNTGKPLLRTNAVHAERLEAKNAEIAGSADLASEFTIEGGDVEGRSIVIVDDVYKTGRTMRAVAKVARAAGATEVYGLVGARTMRKGS